MKRDCYSLYDYARRLTDKDGEEKREKEPDVDPQPDPKDSLLSLVYAVDERTQLPTGDLQYLVSDKANPQVKQFILDNLMQDVSAAQNVSAKYNLSDDDILALSRNQGESIQEYADRLNASIEKDRWMIEQAVSQNTNDVSFESGETSVSSE